MFAGPRNMVRTFFVEFCDNSNIHGVRYFTERGLHWSERLWWLIAIAISLWMCGSLTRNIWNDWNNKPVTISLTEKKEPIATIPFPQVTICPSIKSGKQYFNITEALELLSNLTYTKRQQLNALAHICPLLPEKLNLTDDFINKSYFNIFRDLNPETSKHIHSLRVTRHMEYDLYTNVPMLTSEGICYTFNALDSSQLYTDEVAPDMMAESVTSDMFTPNWHFETPFNYDGNESGHPYHTYHYGSDSGVLYDIVVDTENVDFKCNGLDQGFKVALNVPGESVSMKDSIRIPPSERTNIVIKPKLTFTSDRLRKYDPNQRQCYFDFERKLRFFRIYSQSSCNVECLFNFTNIECGCVELSMPRDKLTRICGGAKIACYKSAESNFRSESFKPFRDKCNCLPSCTTIDYNTQIERSKVDHKQLEKEIIEESMKRIRYGMLYVYFDAQYMDTVKRIPVYTYSDFLAICGGLLGLFLGVSSLSIIEIVFYSTLRLIWINRILKSSMILSSMKQKVKNFRFIKGFRWFFTELCDNSNIHGFLYFTRRNLHWTERLWWMIAIGVSIWLCISFIQDSLVQWNENLVTLSFAKSPVPVSIIPLPTITICTEVKATMDRLYSESQSNVDFNVFSHISAQFVRFAAKSLILLSKTESTGIYDAIRRISPQLDETMVECRWNNKLVACSEYFTSVMTEEGHCFSFNTLNSDDIYTDKMAPGMKIVNNRPNISNWNFQNGYTDNRSGKVYPMRMEESADEITLKVSLVIFEEELGLFNKMFGNDFKIIFTTPGDALKFSKSVYRVPLSGDVRINIKPKLTTTSEGLRSYTPNQRQCYFDSERKLRFFKIYSQSNCEDECLANHLNQIYQCVTFVLPRDNKTAICGLGIKPNISILEAEFWSDGRVNEARKKEAIREKCNCLPTCNTIDYSVGIDTTNIYYKDHIGNKGRPIKRADLYISFGNQPLEIVERIETYTVTDFLAICGGLLGLFMGMSTLSIIELIYFCSLRWFWKLQREEQGNEIEYMQPITDVTPQNIEHKTSSHSNIDG